MTHRNTFAWLTATLFLGSLSAVALAQPAPTPAGNGGGNGGGDRSQRQFDPAQFRQHMLDRFKEQLGLKDDEFQALQPKLEKVLDLRRNMIAGAFGGMGGGGMGGHHNHSGGTTPAASTNAPTSDVQKKMQDLQTALANKDAPVGEIKTKLADLREARTKAKAELTKAEEDLRQLLDQRQEAILVMSGLLD